ncbi:MAG: MurR/RpiR family transcriptional regulator [Terracidiphilus sp.]|jgi:DNA-binding MurR/RpiR family transcriptional regulator
MTRKLEKSPPPNTIQTRINQLSSGRREALRQVLENPREFVLPSVRAAAGRLNVDPATLIRMVQRLGFDGYRAFQNYLHDLSIANATSLDGMQNNDRENSKDVDPLRVTLEQDVKNLNQLYNGIDMLRLHALARRIHSARRVLILGGDLAENLVHYFEHHLTLIGLPVLAATSVGRTLHISRAIGKGDVVIAISFRKGLRQTVEGLQRARANGAYCVGITGTYVSPIARFTNEFFVVSVESRSFIDSYVAPMALVNLILVACGNYKRKDTLRMLALAAKEQREGFRWFDSE